MAARGLSSAAGAAASVTRTVVNPLVAFGISGSSGLYDRARPQYPAEAISRIFNASLPTKSKSDDALAIVELGAGTGLFTRGMIAHLARTLPSASVTCVEPSEGMRIGFNNSLTDRECNSISSLKIVDGTFDRIPVADASTSIVVVAQAFHWVGKDGSTAIKEIARILKPGGKLCLIWNLEDQDSARWVADVRAAYEKFESGTPQYRLGYWKSIFETDIYKSSFAKPIVEHYHRQLSTTSQGAIERMLSKSYITVLPKDEQDRLVEKVGKILKEGRDKVWIDESQDRFEYPYTTDLYIIERK